MPEPFGTGEDYGAHQLLQQLTSEDAWRLTPATMAVELTNGKWKPVRHLLFKAAVIASAIAKGDARILISAPSRHGKSELLCVHTPVWFLEHWPQFQVMIAAYGADLADFHARKVRDLINSRQDLLSVRLKRDAQQLGHFLTDEGGGVVSAGIGGPVIGKGANLLLVDDYFKTMKEAHSPVKKEEVFEWFGSVALSRLEPGASIIIDATRWGPDDLIGRLISEQGLQKDGGVWQYICLPAIADHNPELGESDPLGREVGEALWPERRNEQQWAEFRKMVTTYVWQAMWQQKPVGRIGIHTDGIQVVNILPARERLKIVRFWDLASSKDFGDWSCGVLMAHDRILHLNYILDVRRGQKSPGDLEKWLHQTAQFDQDKWGEVTIGIEQEPGSGGKIAAEYLKKQVFRGFSVTIVPVADSSKIIRAQPFLAAVENGVMRQLQAGWNARLVQEINSFPGGTNDDIIDSASGAYNMLEGKRLRSGSFGREMGKIMQPERRQYDGGISTTTGVVWGRSRTTGHREARRERAPDRFK